MNAVVSISGCATLDEALGSLLDAALDVTGMEGGGAYQVQDDVAVLRHRRGLPDSFIREVTRKPLAPVPLQTLLGQREPVELAEISPTMRELFRRHGIRHAFSFPLRARGSLFGFLNLGSTRAEAPEKAAVRAILLLVNGIESLFFRLYSEEALRESELRYKTLWESALDGVALHEPLSSSQRGRFINVNDCLCRMLGYSREELLKLSPFDLMEDNARETVSELAARIHQSGRMLFEMTALVKDGRRISVEINANIIQLGGRPVALSIIRDITERKRMTEMLQHTNECLEQQVQARTRELNQTVDRLQGAMNELEHRADQLQKLTLELVEAEDNERKRLGAFLHDDLQQTLAAAKFHLGTLGRRVQNDAVALEIMEQTTRVLKEAIEKSRTLSHELGPPVLYRGKLDAVFEWLASQMESKHGLTVHVDIHGPVDSDSEQVRDFLYRAAHEVLFNMVKHAHVRSAGLRLQRVRDELWLTLCDKGRGFNPASLAKADGLGLTTIRERIELLGGRFKIKSTPGRGSIFFIAVPDTVA